ncbi:MAG: cisplatin damage response ATP-dependent DNA ligase [Rhodospirillaceae bacterium]|nr:cisplatin damage response ATP-dependent DNA ligase [Rhodospirillaceae bacterium]
MKPFAALLDRLVYTPGRNTKLALMGHYFATVLDPDRGWGLAALTGAVGFDHAKPALIRALIAERTDPVLFALSYDYVGDLAETSALMWPDAASGGLAPRLSEIVETLRRVGKAETPRRVAAWLDRLDATGRWALLKFLMGGLRVGVSERLAKTALAERFAKPLADIEELWPALAPPYEALFAWLENRAPRPEPEAAPRFRPFMLSQTMENIDELAGHDWQVEWKWDGVRVQFVSEHGAKRLFSRQGEDISAAFPDLLAGIDADAVIDGELLVRGADGHAAPFNDLQQRLNRKTVTGKMLNDYPAFIRAYDLLVAGGEDLRALPLARRRARLEALVARAGGARLDISEILPLSDPAALAKLQAEARSLGREGLMLKRCDSAYVAGRVKGHWFKWKRDPHTADAVLMYAQRGHGKRSSFYSDYTFGVWRGDELVPVGKAYFGFTDEELKQLDKWVRDHTVQRFGPVREVEKRLVLEVAFDSIAPSPRHKSGLAMRFPRVARIRWDKPAAEADRIENLEKLIEARPERTKADLLRD